MRGATECRVSRRRPIPLVIRGSCRAPRLTMGAPKARNRDDADRLPVVVASADRILHTPNTDYRSSCSTADHLTPPVRPDWRSLRSHATPRWRKGDSNSWSDRKRDAVPITTSPAKCDNVRRAVSFATFQTTTYRSGGSLKSAARRIRNPGGSARETHGIGTPARCRAANRPSVTGMLSWVWVNALLMWAGMSSGPSSLWRYGATFSGTMRGRKASRSRLTSGDAFSWISSGAEVCGM